jgi:hypothetical protein
VSPFKKPIAFIKLWIAASKAAKKNKRNLVRLEELFAEGADGEKILANFNLNDTKLAYLSRLALQEDGWYPINSIITQKDPDVVQRELLDLTQGGFILAKPFSNLVKLSDSGRFVLILSDYPPVT